MPSSGSSSASEPRPRSGEEGFTILETLVVLAVCSIALFSLWALAMRLGTAFSASGTSGAASLKAATVDRALRALCARARPPFWAKLQKDAFTEGQAAIPYLDGEPSSFLRLGSAPQAGSFTRRVLLEAGDTRLIMEGFDSFAVEPLYAAGRLAGIVASYSCDGREFTTRALFSSWSLVGEAHE